MARTVLLFWLLLFLPLLTSGNSGVDTTMENNYIDVEVGNVEELISTLHAMKDPEISDFDGNRTELEPFGNLKSDWFRLHLLREALPKDSLLKNKFNHLSRLLVIAHEQATRFLLLSAPTKLEDALERQTTVSLNIEDRTNDEVVDDKSLFAEREMFFSTENKNVSEKLKVHSDVPTTALKSIEYGVDAEAVESVSTDTTDSVSSLNSSTTIPTLEIQEPTIADDTSIPVTTVPKGKIELLIATDGKSRQTPSLLLGTTESILAVEFSTPFGEYIHQSTETILLDETRKVSTGAEYSSLGTIGNAALMETQPSTGTSSENASISTTEETTKIDNWPVITADPSETSLVAEEHPLAATASNFLSPSTSQSFLSIPNQLLVSIKQKAKNISSPQPTINPLSNNSTTASLKIAEALLSTSQTQSTLEDESSRRDSEIREGRPSANFNRVSSNIGRPSITSDTIKKNEDIALTSSLNNSTAIDTAMSEKSRIANVSLSTKDSVESSSSVVTATIDQHDKNHTKNTLYDKLTGEISSSTDSMTTGGSSSLAPNIGKSKDNELKSENNQSEVLTKKDSIGNVSDTTNHVDGISSTDPLIEMNKENYLMREKNASISDYEDIWSTPPRGSTSVSIDLQVAGNDAKLDDGERDVAETSGRVTQSSPPLDLSIEAVQPAAETGSASSGRINQSIIITTEKNQVNGSSQPKNAQHFFESTTKEAKNSKAAFIETLGELAVTKPYFVKNPLNNGPWRNNNVYQTFNHYSNDSEIAKNAKSDKAVLFKFDGYGKNGGSAWRPQLARQPPDGNSIWRFDSFPKNSGPHSYRQPGPTSAVSEADIHEAKKKSAKLSGQGSRTNLVRSQKRGSSKADIRKQFRWFYRQAVEAGVSPNSRLKGNGNTKIKIQCKKAAYDGKP